MFHQSHVNQFFFACSMCVNCGPRPNLLVIDGIAMGLQKSVLDRYEDIVAEEIADNFGP